MAHIPTSKERRALGQARRKQVPRQDHGRWDAKLRQHDAAALVAESMRGRVPGLVALKYERMLASPFGYFRGAVPVMAADLARSAHGNREPDLRRCARTEPWRVCGAGWAAAVRHHDLMRRFAGPLSGI